MYRKPDIKITVDRWDWDSVQQKDTVDITSLCTSYTFQKSIKSPDSGANIDIIPQRDDFNVMDDLNPLDVVKIFEFGKQKFQGYIKRMPFTG